MASGPVAKRAQSGRACPFPSRNVAHQFDDWLVGFPGLLSKAREHRPNIAGIKRLRSIHLAGEETLAEWAPGNEADSEFFTRRQYFRFRISRPQRVFALDRSDRLHGMRPADRR